MARPEVLEVLVGCSLLLLTLLFPRCVVCQDPAMSQFYAFVLSQAFHWLAFNWESASEGLVPPEALKSR